MDNASDKDLLLYFADQRDGDALAQLMFRHGPTVMGVCRRMLGNQADADDALQATFLVLAQRARQVAGHRCLAAWLHRVAARICLDVRRAQVRRQRHEWAAGMLRQEQPAANPWPAAERMLDHAINALPQKYRVAVVLHHLEGRSQEQAADIVGCRTSTMAMRLTRGREMLRQRLMRYAEMEVVELPHETAQLSAELTNTTAGVAVALVSGGSAAPSMLHAIAWSKAFLRSLWLAQAKVAAAVLIAATGAAAVTTHALAQPASRPAATAPAAITAPAPNTDYAALAIAEAEKPMSNGDRIGCIERVIEAQIAHHDYIGAEATIRRLRDARQEAYMREAIAIAMADAGDLDAARDYIEQIDREDARTYATAVTEAAEVDRDLKQGKRDDALRLADAIKDPLGRLMAYNRIVSHMATHGDPAGARALLPKLREAAGPPLPGDLGLASTRLLATSMAIAGADDQAMELANADRLGVAAEEIAGAQAARGDVAAAEKTIEGMPAHLSQVVACCNAARECLVRKDQQQARKFIDRAVALFHAGQRDALMRWGAHYIAQQQGALGLVEDAKAVAEAVNDEGARSLAYERVAAAWTRRDGPVAAAAWVRSLPSPQERSNGYAGILRGLAPPRQ